MEEQKQRLEWQLLEEGSMFPMQQAGGVQKRESKEQILTIESQQILTIEPPEGSQPCQQL